MSDNAAHQFSEWDQSAEGTDIISLSKGQDTFLLPDQAGAEKAYFSSLLQSMAGLPGNLDTLGMYIPSPNFNANIHITNIFTDYLLFLINKIKGNTELRDNLREIVRLLSDVSEIQKEAIEEIQKIIDNIPDTNTNTDTYSTIKKTISTLFNRYRNGIKDGNGGNGENGEIKAETDNNNVEFQKTLDYRMHAKFATYFTIIKYLMTLNTKSGSKINLNLNSIAPNIQTIKDNFFDREGNFYINFLTHIYEYLTEQATHLETDEITNITALLQKIQSLYEASNKKEEDQVNAMIAVCNLLYGYDVNVLHLFVGENGGRLEGIIQAIADQTQGDYRLLQEYLNEIFENQENDEGKGKKKKIGPQITPPKIKGIATIGIPIIALLFIMANTANIANAMNGHTMGYHMPHINLPTDNPIQFINGMASPSVAKTLLDSIKPPTGTKRIQMGPDWGLMPEKSKLKKFTPNQGIKTISPNIEIGNNYQTYTLNAWYPGGKHNVILRNTEQTGKDEYRCSVGDQESAEQKESYPFDTNLIISGYRNDNGERIPVVNIGGKTLYLPGFKVYGLTFGEKIMKGAKKSANNTYTFNSNYGVTYPIRSIIIEREGNLYIIPIGDLGYVATSKASRETKTLSDPTTEKAPQLTDQEKLNQVKIIDDAESSTTNIQIGNHTVGVHSLFFGPYPKSEYNPNTGIVTIKSTGKYANNNNNTIQITVTEDGKYKVMVTYKGGKTEYVPSDDFYIFPTNENGENYSDNIIYIADHTENLLFTITHMPDHAETKMFTMPKTLKIGNETIEINIKDIVYCAYINNIIIVKVGDNLYQATLETSKNGTQAQGRTQISEAQEMITSTQPMNLEEIKNNPHNTQPFFVTLQNTPGKESKIFQVIPLPLGNYAIVDNKNPTAIPVGLPSITNIRYIRGKGYVFPTETGGYKILTIDAQGSLTMETHTSAIKENMYNLTMQLGTGDIQYDQKDGKQIITYTTNGTITSFTFADNGNITSIRSGNTWIIDKSGLMIAGDFIITNNNIYNMNTGIPIENYHSGTIQGLCETIQKFGIKPTQIDITTTGTTIDFPTGSETDNEQLSIVSQNDHTWIKIGNSLVKIGNIKMQKVGNYMIIMIKKGLTKTYYVLNHENPIKIQGSIGKNMFKNPGGYRITTVGGNVNVTSNINHQQP